MKLPAHVLFRKDLRASKPFNRFADLSALDMVDLNFKFVFHIELNRRLVFVPHSPVKSAFYVTSPRLLITPSCTRC